MNDDITTEDTEDVEISLDEARASLGLATRLSEQYLANNHRDTSETNNSQNIMVSQDTSNQKIDNMNSSLSKEELKKELAPLIKSLISEEISGLREDIKSALLDGETEETNNDQSF